MQVVHVQTVVKEHHLKTLGMLIVAQELDSLNHGDGILIGKVVGWEDLGTRWWHGWIVKLATSK